MLYEKLKYLVKYNKALLQIYKFAMNFFVRIMGFFLQVKEDYVLFVVYGGQRYDDSPKEVYEYMKKDPRFRDYQMYWAFIEPDKITEDIENKVKIDTLQYYITALQCKYWITNSSASRSLNFMPKETINIFFSHGIAGIKKLGSDIHTQHRTGKVNKERQNYIVIGGKQEEAILNRAWEIDPTKTTLLNIGLPRYEELAHIPQQKVEQLKAELKIPPDKKVILYAPTFREYKRDSLNATFLAPPFDFDKWYRELGDEYVLLLTAHYEVAKLMDIPSEHPFVINAFKYPHINDLMVVSDILITDYSSIVFDFCILGRPIISYAYDYKQYSEERGIYDGYESLFRGPICNDEDAAISYIKNIDYESECEHTKHEIRDKYISNYENTVGLFIQAVFGTGENLEN